MLKRFSSYLCAGMVAVALVGCGSGSSESTSTPADTTASGSGDTAKKFRIGISVPSADHGWTGGALYWAEQAAEKLGGEAEFTVDTCANAAEQTKDLDTLAAKGIDGLVILAHDASVTQKVKELHDKGTLVVSVDRGMTEDACDIYLAGDNKEFGTMSGEYIAEKLQGKGNILIFRGIPGVPIDQERFDGAMAVFKKHPEIKVLDSQHGKWSREEAYKVAKTLLVKHAKIDAIWSSDDDMSEGIETALKEANRAQGIWMLGGGGKKEIVKRIMDGDPMYPALVTYPPSMTKQGVEKCVEVLKSGKKPAKMETIKIKLDVVKPDNAKDFYFPNSVY